MHHRTIIRFVESGREITLLTTGTFWPHEVWVDGEGWVMGDVIDWGPNHTVREYHHDPAHKTPGQRLLHALKGQS